MISFVKPSTIHHTKTAPTAKAERLIQIPIKRPNEKNPKSLTKNANMYWMSIKIIEISVKSEYKSPRIRDTMNTNSVDNNANAIIVRNLDITNSFYSIHRLNFV